MEYLDKKGLAHLVEKNNETYALKIENNNLKGQVLSLKAKLKKRDKKIVVRKAINPNSVNEGNVWYYHNNPTLLMGNGYSRYKIYINGEEVTASYLKVVRGCTRDKRKLYVQYSHEQKRFWTYYKDDSGKNIMWLEYIGIAVDLSRAIRANDMNNSYLSKVSAVEYDENLHMMIVHIEMQAVLTNTLSSTTSSPYLKIVAGRIVSTGVVPVVVPEYSTSIIEGFVEGREVMKGICHPHGSKLYYWKLYCKKYKEGGFKIHKRKFQLCLKGKNQRTGKYKIKFYKRGIYCGERFFVHQVLMKNNNVHSHRVKEI